MMVFLHEMRQNAKMLAVWSVVIGGMVVLCVAMFPDISAQSEDFTAMFSSLGVFTEAFGMDQLSIGERWRTRSKKTANASPQLTPTS